MTRKIFNERFTGKELWQTINLILFFAAYTSMFIVPFLFPEHIGTLFIVLAFIGITYVAIQQSMFRKMEAKNAGRRVLAGWLDEEEGLGEEYEIPISKITPFGRLSEIDRKNAEKFMTAEYERAVEDGLIDDDKIKNIPQPLPVKPQLIENKKEDESSYEFKK